MLPAGISVTLLPVNYRALNQINCIVLFCSCFLWAPFFTKSMYLIRLESRMHGVIGLFSNLYLYLSMFTIVINIFNYTNKNIPTKVWYRQISHTQIIEEKPYRLLMSETARVYQTRFAHCCIVCDQVRQNVSSWRHVVGQRFDISSTDLSWIKSYLLNRSFNVNIENFKSSVFQLLHGVPQGSVIGPLLCIVYTTPLSTVISNSSANYQLYDDCWWYSSSLIILSSEFLS